MPIPPRPFQIFAFVGLLASQYVTAIPPTSQPAPFALEGAGIADLQQRMAKGQISSRAIVQQYLDRIAALDKAGPTINAIIELNPEALALAERLDAERKSGTVRGPLQLSSSRRRSSDRLMNIIPSELDRPWPRIVLSTNGSSGRFLSFASIADCTEAWDRL
jgi:hypothetical protein